MKNLLISILVCTIAMVTITGCSTKFNIAAPYQNITIVYGLLDEADTAHYIRIQKAFLSQTLNSYDMAKVSDSSFYPQLNVVMEGFSNGSMMTTTTLTRVDLTQEGYPKDSGTFFTAPNYAYKFKDALNPAYTYRLVITNPSSGVVDSAETTVIDESPNVFKCQLIDDHVNTLNFTHINGVFSVAGSVANTVAYMQGTVRVRWVDVNTQTSVTTKRYADWNFASETPAGNGGGGATNGFNLTTNNVAFYDFLESAMQPAPQYVTRYLDSAYVSLNTANADFYTYMQITQTIGTGLTGMDIEPNYTDLKGKNVLGIYGSRGARATYITYDPATVDSLEASPLLTNLNIKGTSY